MYIWLILLIIYLPLQIALNPSHNFDLASLRILIVLFFMIWAIKGFINKTLIKNLQRFKNLQGISLILFLFLISISLIGAENVFWGVRKVIFFLSIFPLYYLTISLIDNKNKIEKVIKGLVVGGVIVSFIGICQFLAQFVFSLEKIYNFWALNIVPIFSGFNFGALILSYSSWLVNINGNTILRSFSIFSDPHMFSFYLGLILPLAIVSIFLQKTKQRRIFTLIGCFLLYFAVLLSFTRGAYFALIVTFLILAWFFWRYLKLKKTAVLISLPLLIFIISVTPFADRFYSSFDMSDGSNIGRLEMWQQASRTGLENPWQGIGLGNYSLFVDANLGYRNPVTAHNLYLDLFSESGIFTLIVWLVLISGTIWQMFLKIRKIKKQGFNKDQALIQIGLIGSLVYFLAHSFFETAVYNPAILAVLMVILGISTLSALREEN